MAANELGLETLKILDLFGEIYPLPEAKHIVCMNKNVELSLKNKGLKGRSYYHLGQPAVENTVNKILELNKELICSKINISKDKKIILYASQVPISHDSDCKFNSILDYNIVNKKIFHILNTIHKKFDVNIIFRLHPNEDINNYKKWFSQYSFINLINNDLNVSESIAVSDLIITPYSTIAVEAIVANKTVLTYKNDLSSCYPEVQMKIKPFIFSDGFEALEKNLCKYLDNPTKRDDIDDFMPKDAAKNIAKLIKEL
jgi:CDP-glycerol glycerophosphotransferase (TagB/SpsB family)